MAIRALAPKRSLISPRSEAIRTRPASAWRCLKELGPPPWRFLGTCASAINCLAQWFGGRVGAGGGVIARQDLAGGLHGGEGVFEGGCPGRSPPNPAYHSLIAERDSLPPCLESTAWLRGRTIMGLQPPPASPHAGRAVPPGECAHQDGHRLLANFLRPGPRAVTGNAALEILASALLGSRHSRRRQAHPPLASATKLSGQAWPPPQRPCCGSRAFVSPAPARASGVTITSYGQHRPC